MSAVNLIYGSACFVAFAAFHFVDPGVFRFEVTLGNVVTIVTLIWGVFQIQRVAARAENMVEEHNYLWVDMAERRGFPLEEDRRRKYTLVRRPPPSGEQDLPQG